MGFGDLFRPAQPARQPGEISVGDALIKLAAGGVLIDVRARADYERGHIPGARLVALGDLQDNPLEAIWGGDPLAETNKPVVVISATPAHANAIAHLLRDKDVDAYALAGGLLAWVQEGQPLIPGPPR